ncbi:hypothetical protein LCGC14_0251670 [marine sediment metagenome]|uniref:Uncharacterized protein n=1 Tax=marine sediment metagenome TaxID=412755 RepID=A0A0F9U4C8_9ZZZZ
MVNKPLIAGHQFEYAAATLISTHVDGQQINPWIDSKPGGGTNATASQGVVRFGAIGGLNQWDDNEPGVVFDRLDGLADTLSFSPGGMLLSSLTFFAVVETTVLDTGCAIIGTTDGIDPATGLYLVVYPDGSLHFIVGKNGVLPALDVASAAGLFVDGTRAIITARLDVPTGGAVLRVNREQVASFSGVDLGSDFWFAPKIGQANLPIGNLTGDDRNMPFISGYNTAASDSRVGQMEAWLHQEFFSTPWTPCNPDPGTVWAACN